MTVVVLLQYCTSILSRLSFPQRRRRWVKMIVTGSAPWAGLGLVFFRRDDFLVSSTTNIYVYLTIIQLFFEIGFLSAF